MHKLSIYINFKYPNGENTEAYKGDWQQNSDDRSHNSIIRRGGSDFLRFLHGHLTRRNLSSGSANWNWRPLKARFVWKRGESPTPSEVVRLESWIGELESGNGAIRSCGRSERREEEERAWCRGGHDDGGILIEVRIMDGYWLTWLEAPFSVQENDYESPNSNSAQTCWK